MTKLTILPVVLALGLIAGCEKAESGAEGIVDAAGEGAEGIAGAAGDLMNKATESLNSMADIDLAGLSPDKLKEKGGEMISGLASQLGNISDLASAESISKAAGPVIEKLGSLKGMLGDNLPDMSSLSEAVSGLTSKFADKADVMKVLQPMIDKITGMIG